MPTTPRVDLPLGQSRALLGLLFSCAGPLLSGCTAPAAPVTAAPGNASGTELFRDATERAGIDFTYGFTGRSPLTILGTANGGCGFLDFDHDGRLDLVLVGQPSCALYRNLGGCKFADVSREVRLTHTGQWMGCAIADYDADGFPDLYLTGYRTAALLRNAGGRRFVDETTRAGLSSRFWTTSADFCDLDQDGDLDLYVGAYLDFHLGKNDLCRLGDLQAACGPEHFEAERGRLYLNRGNGTFEDGTVRYGLNRAAGKTWGVAFCDYDADGWPDLYLGNDTTPSNLFRNRQGTHFEEVGVRTGTGVDAGGSVMGAMGVDWGDGNNDGWPDLFVTTFFQQANALFYSEGGATFRHASAEAGLDLPSRPYVGFGGGFVDVDNDGDLDLFVTNGHVRDDIPRHDASQTYAQPLQLFLNEGQGRYRSLGREAGAIFAEPMVGRGAAFGDYDGDGDRDVLVAALGGKARLLENTHSGSAGHSLTLRLAGRGKNTEALGARIEVTAGTDRRVRWCKRGGSVLSASDAEVHVGLGLHNRATRVAVTWPDGKRRVWKDLAAGTVHTLRP